MSFERGTIIALAPSGEGAPWRFFVIGCKCRLPLQRKWHLALTEAEECGASVIASTRPPGAG